MIGSSNIFGTTPQLSYEELWRRFIERQRPVLDNTGQYQPVSQTWVEREAEKELHNKEQEI